MPYEDQEDELMDRILKSSKHEKTCWNCKHLHSNNTSCDAFPNVIPIVYITGQKEHTSAKRQSNEIVWELDKDSKHSKRQVRKDERTDVKTVDCGTDYFKANREAKKLVKAGYRVNITTFDSFPQEYTVIGVK